MLNVYFFQKFKCRIQGVKNFYSSLYLNKSELLQFNPSLQLLGFPNGMKCIVTLKILRNLRKRGSWKENRSHNAPEELILSANSSSSNDDSKTSQVKVRLHFKDFLTCIDLDDLNKIIVT